jgi:hypothetical protein
MSRWLGKEEKERKKEITTVSVFFFDPSAAQKGKEISGKRKY